MSGDSSKSFIHSAEGHVQVVNAHLTSANTVTLIITHRRTLGITIASSMVLRCLWQQQTGGAAAGRPVVRARSRS